MRRLIEHSIVRIVRHPDGAVTRTWLGDFLSLAEARTAAKGDPAVVVVPTDLWHNGEGRDKAPLA